jgi:hypothetical protein
VDTGTGIRAEKSADAVVLLVPTLADDADNAARLAAGKHLLENYLQYPLIVKSAAKPDKLVTLPARLVPEFSVASD